MRIEVPETTGRLVIGAMQPSGPASGGRIRMVGTRRHLAIRLRGGAT